MGCRVDGVARAAGEGESRTLARAHTHTQTNARKRCTRLICLEPPLSQDIFQLHFFAGASVVIVVAVSNSQRVLCVYSVIIFTVLLLLALTCARRLLENNKTVRVTSLPFDLRRIIFSPLVISSNEEIVTAA